MMIGCRMLSNYLDFGPSYGLSCTSFYRRLHTNCLASRVRDLPHGKRRELEKILSTPVSDGWKDLAKELGYTSRRLTQFEARGKSENSCFKHMLHDWERHQHASVNQLIQSLRNIGRDDATRILYFDSTEGRTQTMAKHCQMV